jgi:hypothetical protein
MVTYSKSDLRNKSQRERVKAMNLSISDKAKRLMALVTKVRHFGDRNLEEEAKKVSYKMEHQDEGGLSKSNSASNLSKEELEIVAKDRTPG